MHRPAAIPADPAGRQTCGGLPTTSTKTTTRKKVKAVLFLSLDSKPAQMTATMVLVLPLLLTPCFWGFWNVAIQLQKAMIRCFKQTTK
jgi:hypothetical protein